MSLYRRLATIDNDADIESFAAEMVDRFGPLPPECDQLFKIVAIKALCRRANIEKVEAGPKGIIVSFRDNAFANPTGWCVMCRIMAAMPECAQICESSFRAISRRPRRGLDTTRRLLWELVKVAEKKT